MKVIKRNGSESDFDARKIKNAMSKASYATANSKLTEEKINQLTENISYECLSLQHAISIEEIQDKVENALMSIGEFDVARNYIKYRYQRMLNRNSSTLDDKIMSIVELSNQEVMEENSNKNPIINSTQRDYIAGEASRDISGRKIIPKDILDAHNEGAIHIHDTDYLIQRMHNCDLINLEDMLQNGTVISETMIESPKSFSTACNIATQIIAQVASSQYGGQTVTLSHIAPFVNVSRKKIRSLVEKEFEGVEISKERLNEIVEKRVKDEVKKGVQTIQYQVLTLLTTNGQTPFLTVFMYLGEVSDPQTKDDLALIIEETLKQRIQGIKNVKGEWITPAFPKLIYCLEEDNIHEDSKYWYLTELAAKCTAKRLVPDYLSEKIVKQIKKDKNGDSHVICPMGCVDGQEVITYKFNNRLYTESFERMWNRLSLFFPVYHQNYDEDPNLYIDLSNVQIYDTKLSGFTNCRRIIRNISNKWIDINFSNGRRLLCTDDHPLEIINKGMTFARDINIGDTTLANYGHYTEENYNINPELAWTLGVILCDGSYSNRGSIVTSVAANGEDELIDRYIYNMKSLFNVDVDKVLRERGKKGTYYDLIAKSNNYSANLNNYLTSIFEGIQKIYRHIPNEVFEWNYGAKLAFMAGMIDADGYIDNVKSSVVQIGSTNKELAIQQLLLAQSCGMQARLYHNHYNADEPEKIRYRVEFVPCYDLIRFISCAKKVHHCNLPAVYFDGENVNNYQNGNIISVISKREINETNFSYDVTTDSSHFEVSGIYSHNCRSFLSPYVDENGNKKIYGRFNKGVVSINLPYIALLSHGDMEEFWKLFDKYLELCHKGLKCKVDRLKGTVSDVAPILWQHGALARLEKGETIDKLFYGGYSTTSLGYAGLYECTKYMTGKSHTDPEIGKPFALKVMKYMNDKCAEWNAIEDVGYGIYGTPLETTTYKFAKALQKFEKVEDVNDHNYITNSFH